MQVLQLLPLLPLLPAPRPWYHKKAPIEVLKSGAAWPLNSTVGGAAEAVSVELGQASSTLASAQAASVVPPTALTMKPKGPGTPAWCRLYTK